MSDFENSNQKKKPNSPIKKPKVGFSGYWIYGLVLLVFAGVYLFSKTGTPMETTSREFENMVMSGDVKEIVVVNQELARVYIKPDRLTKEVYTEVRKRNIPVDQPQFQLETGPIEKFVEKVDLLQEALPADEKVMIDYETQNESWFNSFIIFVLPLLIMMGLWFFMMRRMGGGAGGGQIFNIGKSKAKLFDKDSQVNINFNDVAGLDEAKVELQEIVEFLKNPKKYTNLGGKIPKGALLVGPPGTGKTLLAKAIAGEAKVPFFSLSGSDFVEMFVGVGASRVRDLFRQAKEKSPCIIFIDEIDAIGRARGRGAVQGANDERENTLNQLLTEMDGFESNSGVIILAATNRVDVLDKALIRAGRFDRQIMVELPDLFGRQEIFKVHMKGKKLGQNIDVNLLAKQTPGFSGADIANVCNEAALIAARKGKDEIDRSDFNDAIDRVIGGLEKKNKIVTPIEKKVIAYHEAGHATVSWFLRYASPLVKVTIVPRGQSLGAAWYLPEERMITTKEQILDEMTAALGGRAAEEVIFQKVSTGALSDLEKITKQAYAMVSIYGLNDIIGNISYYDSSGQQDYAFSKPYSDKTAELIDQEVKKLSDECYQRAVKLLEENKDKLKKLADRLIEKEVIFREDLEEILGPRPFEDDERAKEVSAAVRSTMAQNNQPQNPDHSTPIVPSTENPITIDQEIKRESEQGNSTTGE